MRKIIKGIEPKSFTDSKSSYSIWKDLNGDVKKDLRKALCSDQHFVCCYCGKRIDPKTYDGPHGENNVVIEHILPKRNPSYAPLMFDYSNLLASCNGNKYMSYQGSGYEKEDWFTCDDAKGNDVISVSPLNPSCENRTIVAKNGKLLLKDSSDIDFEETLFKLKLNARVLMFERKKIIAVYFKDAKSRSDREYIEKIINKMDQVNANGQLPPYSYQVKRYAENLLG